MKMPSPQTTKRVLLIVIFVAVLLSIVPVMATAAPPAQQPSTFMYYVRYGDTLYAIAMRYGTTVPAIMQANGLTSEYIYAGQRLVIPTAPVPPPPNFACTYTVQARDTIYSIAYRYGAPWYQLMQANYLYSPYIYVGQQLRVPCLTPAPTPFPTHTVQTGDNLFRIAIKYSTSVYAIALVNGIWNPNLVFVGQTLVIPYPGSVKWPPVPTITPNLTPSGTTPTLTPTVGPSPTATTAPTGAPSAVIVMTNLTFIPNTITIPRGGTVQWKNTDAVNHTVTSGAPGAPTNIFQSGTLTPNQTFSFTFPNAGTFPYFSEPFPTMVGTITVQ